MSKPEVENVEYGAHETSSSEPLDETYRQFLMERHGTVELDPMPQMDDADPLNWPLSKRLVNLALVAFHAFMATFTAAAIQSAFVPIAEDLGVSVHRTTYLTSLVIAILGGAPLIWRPLSQRFGRRPIFLISLIVSLIGNIGCANSPNYATMALCRAIVGFFISPAAAIGSGIITETFFRRERARYMGIWTSMVTLGIPIAAIIFGFVALRVGYRWIYYVLAITNGVQFVLYFFFGPETRYVPKSEISTPGPKPTWRQEHLNFRRIDPSPLTLGDFLHPLGLAIRPCVMIPAAAHAMIFLWASIMVAIEIPQLYPVKFGFNTQQVGLQNVSILVGTIIGEQMGGVLSDKWMWLREKRGKALKLEFRLWIAYIGYVLTIVGIAVFLVMLDRSTKWDVVPLVGVAIAAAGNQVVTTVMTTYAVDCHFKDAAAIGVFISFVRQIWGFCGPFWFPEMIKELGLTKSVAVPTSMIVGVAVIPTILVQLFGRKWR